MPNNLGEFRTPIGVVETVKEGKDITLVSYGSTLRIVEEAAKELQQAGIDAEVNDVQSLLPLDINHDMVKSVADDLGNTPTVCRASYINPIIIERFLAGNFFEPYQQARRGRNKKYQSCDEKALLGFLSASH